jgi:hypothetical protein
VPEVPAAQGVVFILDESAVLMDNRVFVSWMSDFWLGIVVAGTDVCC